MFLPMLNIKMLELIAPYPFSQINLERPLPLAAYAELKWNMFSKENAAMVPPPNC